jgi:hypothetical protein
LIPFGKVWRTGANENTTVSLSDDVIIDGKTLKKGKYSLYTNPKIESWESFTRLLITGESRGVERRKCST